MFSHAVAVCSRFAVRSYAVTPTRIKPQNVPLVSATLRRHFSITPLSRSPAVLAHAPTQSDIEADEEFSETELVPHEEATLNITDAAAEQLRNISVRDQDDDVSLRVLVESGGCHGYQYKLELTSKRQPSDYHFARPPTTPGRVGVVVDPVSLSLLKVSATNGNGLVGNSELRPGLDD
ncbi:unnamed protein product [Rhizoctonia solani]|uniref:Core domain-containing protein n=1 Tax=Rhizoctonia solani TaxID=456999 RepID=A0A8H3ANE9_9AGAM|nr:unnamed protein product [Rhizoctonia solani]